MARPEPLLSVVIPCKDEAESLPGLVSALATWERLAPLELLFVDDGSLDATADLVPALFPGARLLRHPTNRGIGAALRTGSLAATGTFVAWFDADASYDPAVLPRMTERLQASRAAAITVSPWAPGGGSHRLPFHRKLPSLAVSRLYRLCAPGRLFTYTAMVRVHRREALLAALPRRDGFPGVTESLLRILLQGGQVLELPAPLHPRRSGHSKARLAREIRGHLGLLGALLLGRLGAPGSASVRPAPSRNRT